MAQASAVDHAESSAQAELRGKRYPHWSTQPDTPISSLLSLNRPTPRSYATHVRTRKNALVMSSHAPQYVHTSHTARSMPRASLPNLGTVIDLPSFSTQPGSESWCARAAAKAKEKAIEERTAAKKLASGIAEAFESVAPTGTRKADDGDLLGLF